jgi:hypothetical protein
MTTVKMSHMRPTGWLSLTKNKDMLKGGWGKKRKQKHNFIINRKL